MYFDMLPQYTISKKGVKEVRIRSSGAEKRRLTVALSCTGSGEMLPSLAIFKGKRKLKFKSPKDINVAVQVKGWMDGDLMLRWFRATIVPYTRGEKALLLIDSFSAHESEEFMEMAKDNNVDVIIIPGGCTSKIQPLDVCLNKPFKSILRKKWLESIEAQVEANPNLQKLTTASKETCCHWIKAGQEYLAESKEMIKKSFLVCGLTNALDGSQNDLIRCAKELPDLQLPYVDESEDDPFNHSDESESDSSRSDSDDDSCSDE